MRVKSTYLILLDKDPHNSDSRARLAHHIHRADQEGRPTVSYGGEGGRHMTYTPR